MGTTLWLMTLLHLAAPAGDDVPQTTVTVVTTVDAPDVPCQLGLQTLLVADDGDRTVVDGGAALAEALTAAIAEELASATGCRVLRVPACAAQSDDCVVNTVNAVNAVNAVDAVDIAAALGVAGLVEGTVTIDPTATDPTATDRVDVTLHLRHAITGLVVRDSRGFLGQVPAHDDVAALVAPLVTGLKREPTPAPTSAPTSAPTPATPDPATAVADPFDDDAAAVGVAADPLPVVWGGAGVSVAGSLVAGAGAVLLGTALVALQDPAAANPEAAREEAVVGGVVLGAGLVVVAGGLAIVAAGLLGAP